jgi:hypothetical protein
MPRPGRLVPAVLVAGLLVAIALLWPDTVDDAGPASAPATGMAGTRPEPPRPPSVPPAAPPAPVPRDEAQPEADRPDIAVLPETAWANVDLAAIREVMPENLFWRMAVPTTDPEVMARRGETRARWNTEYGKILSNTASAEEIDAYYAERQALAQDYVDFATYLLATYGEQLTVRDVGLLKVAIELNLARLERFPRDIADAHERRAAHDAARRAWREQQDLFADLPHR